MHSKPREIYGITGAKGSGKDTFARLVNDAAEPRFAVLSFADPLKNMLLQILPSLRPEDLNDPSRKEQLFIGPVDMDALVPLMASVTGLAIQPRKLWAESPRKLMQYFGTDYVRSICDNYWIQKFAERLVGVSRALIPDTRFTNESDYLRSINAKIIRVVRTDAAPPPVTQHASEQHWRTIPADLVVAAATGDFVTPTRLATLVAQGLFETAIRCSRQPRAA